MRERVDYKLVKMGFTAFYSFVTLICTKVIYRTKFIILRFFVLTYTTIRLKLSQEFRKLFRPKRRFIRMRHLAARQFELTKLSRSTG
jgi:energy-coupling factor transporter transmembrane protein EcfT